MVSSLGNPHMHWYLLCLMSVRYVSTGILVFQSAMYTIGNLPYYPPFCECSAHPSDATTLDADQRSKPRKEVGGTLNASVPRWNQRIFDTCTKLASPCWGSRGYAWVSCTPWPSCPSINHSLLNIEPILCRELYMYCIQCNRAVLNAMYVRQTFWNLWKKLRRKDYLLCVYL